MDTSDHFQPKGLLDTPDRPLRAPPRDRPLRIAQSTEGETGSLRIGEPDRSKKEGPQVLGAPPNWLLTNTSFDPRLWIHPFIPKPPTVSDRRPPEVAEE